jgi:hypothetical protein
MIARVPIPLPVASGRRALLADGTRKRHDRSLCEQGASVR